MQGGGQACFHLWGSHLAECHGLERAMPASNGLGEHEPRMRLNAISKCKHFAKRHACSNARVGLTCACIQYAPTKAPGFLECSKCTTYLYAPASQLVFAWHPMSYCVPLVGLQVACLPPVPGRSPVRLPQRAPLPVLRNRKP